MIVKMFILFYARSMTIARGVLRSPYVSDAINLIASFRHRRLGSTEARKYKSILSPPPISPIAAPSEDQKEHEDDKNEIHNLSPKCLVRNFPPWHMWGQNNYSPASESTYYCFTKAVMKLSIFRGYRSRPPSSYGCLDARNLCPQ